MSRKHLTSRIPLSTKEGASSALVIGSLEWRQLLKQITAFGDLGPGSDPISEPDCSRLKELPLKPPLLKAL